MKLKICACELSKGQLKPKSGEEFSAQLNPSNFTHKRTIEYGDIATAGDVGSESKFVKIAPEDLNFDLVLDGTGVVPAENKDSIPKQIKRLLSVVYRYVGSHHEPNYVQVVWGSFVFYGRMTSLSTTYTLFDSSGVPLRAKLSLVFRSSETEAEQKLVKNNSSPDLSHVIEVRAGDTLPLLCERVYGDGRYYGDVARCNGLSSFRRLSPGMKLHFPPLE